MRKRSFTSWKTHYSFTPSRSSPLFPRNSQVRVWGFWLATKMRQIEEEKGEKMENSMLSAASGPFVDCHASETAFARDDLRNSWKLEFCLEIALASTKIRRASWAELQHNCTLPFSLRALNASSRWAKATSQVQLYTSHVCSFLYVTADLICTSLDYSKHSRYSIRYLICTCLEIIREWNVNNLPLFSFSFLFLSYIADLKLYLEIRRSLNV